MYQYDICNTVDCDIYQKQCIALEKHIPGLKRIKELRDVDGGQYMIYNLNGNRITVKNSFYMDKVYVESDVPLEEFFGK